MFRRENKTPWHKSVNKPPWQGTIRLSSKTATLRKAKIKLYF